MSEAITAYTTTDAIRGAIGLTPSEVTDTMLVDQNLALELENDLLGWMPTHAALYAAGLASGATAAEKQQAALLVLYAQWFCAAQALTLMPLSIPQAIADGKDEMKRFQAMDLGALMDRAVARRDMYKGQLQNTEGATSETSVSIMARGIPDYDPVIG